jgi:hypothetical protein
MSTTFCPAISNLFEKKKKNHFIFDAVMDGISAGALHFSLGFSVSNFFPEMFRY